MSAASAIRDPEPAAVRVLVAEDIGGPGLELLREHFDVELGIGWSPQQLAERIGEFDGILIRSGTSLDAELLGRADRLRAVGRAGVGVDNVDVAAATKQGVVVANAPQSNVITAAEHTMAMLLGTRPEPAAGPRIADRREVGAVEVLRRRAVREDARDPRIRPHRPARRPPRALRSGCA